MAQSDMSKETLASFIMMISKDQERTKELVEKCKKEKVFDAALLRKVSEENLRQMGFMIGEITLIKSSKQSVASQIAEAMSEIKTKYFRRDSTIAEPKNQKKLKTDDDREMTIRIGWKTKGKGKNRRLTVKSGGGIHELKMVKKESTYDNIVSLAKQEILGDKHCDNASLEINRQDVTGFYDINGNECTFANYLKANKMFSSRCKLYLVTQHEEESPSNDESQSRANIEDSQQFDSSCSVELPHISNVLCITYRMVNTDDNSAISVAGKVGVLEKESCTNPDILSISSSEINPIDYGYTISKLSKGYKTFVDWKPTESGEDIEYIFPSAIENEDIILHGPDDVNGYDLCDYIIGVVVSMWLEKPLVEWIRDGETVYSGNGLYIINVTKPGLYYANVIRNGTYTSNAVCVVDSSGELAIGHVVDMKGIPKRRNTEEKHDPALEKGVSKQEIQPSCDTESSSTHVPNISSSEFELGEEIGRGNFGTIYKGRWLGTEVAIKRLPLGKKGKVSQMNALRKEVEMLSRLRHPNLVQIMAFCVEPSKAMILTEYVQGSDLENIIFQEEGNAIKLKLDEKAKVSVTVQVAQGLAYLHGQKPPVIHQDIKPSNILISQKMTVKICDLGISRLRTMHTLARRTTVRCIEGTPIYMAPECILRETKSSTASDIWSFACTALELFTGGDVWDLESTEHEDTTDDYEMKVLTELVQQKSQPHALHRVPNSVPQLVTDILRKCLSYVQRDRPSALDIVQKLSHLQAKCARCCKERAVCGKDHCDA